MKNLQESDFGLKAEWHLFPISHGKAYVIWTFKRLLAMKYDSLLSWPTESARDHCWVPFTHVVCIINALDGHNDQSFISLPPMI